MKEPRKTGTGSTKPVEAKLGHYSRESRDLNHVFVGQNGVKANGIPEALKNNLQSDIPAKVGAERSA